MGEKDSKLYTKILVWCFERQSGFTEQQLWDEFGITDSPALRQWYGSVFKYNTLHNPSLIKHFSSDKGSPLCTLSDKGMTAAVDYIELKEARDASKKAVLLATLSFFLAAMVGITQIAIMLFTQTSIFSCLFDKLV